MLKDFWCVLFPPFFLFQECITDEDCEKGKYCLYDEHHSECMPCKQSDAVGPSDFLHKIVNLISLRGHTHIGHESAEDLHIWEPLPFYMMKLRLHCICIAAQAQVHSEFDISGFPPPLWGAH